MHCTTYLPVFQAVAKCSFGLSSFSVRNMVLGKFKMFRACDWSSAQDVGFTSKVFECILEARVKEHWKRIINSVCCHRDLFKAFYSCLSVKRPLLVHWNDYILPQVQAIYGEQQASRCVFHLFKSFEVLILWNFFFLFLTMPFNIYIFWYKQFSLTPKISPSFQCVVTRSNLV